MYRGCTPANALKSSPPTVAKSNAGFTYRLVGRQSEKSANPQPRTTSRAGTGTRFILVGAKGRPRHFATSYHWVQGSPLPRKRETREGFHLKLRPLNLRDHILLQFLQPPRQAFCVERRRRDHDSRHPNFR